MKCRGDEDGGKGIWKIKLKDYLIFVDRFRVFIMKMFPRFFFYNKNNLMSVKKLGFNKAKKGFVKNFVKNFALRFGAIIYVVTLRSALYSSHLYVTLLILSPDPSHFICCFKGQ